MFVLAIVVVGVGGYFLFTLLTGDGKIGSFDESLPSANPEVALATPSPTPNVPTPAPRIIGNLPIEPVAEAEPDVFGFETSLMVYGEEVNSFTREEPMEFAHGDEYTDLPGIITFGGNNYRDTFTYGTHNFSDDPSLSIEWQYDTSALNTSMGTWTGTGWTGMPLIVEWPKETLDVLGVFEKFKSKDTLEEVMYAALDGNIYFFELQTGEITRDPLFLGVATKGTPSLDPRGYPLLYTGQGIPESDGAYVRVISLIDNEVIWSFGGTDPYAYRDFHAYDSSQLIDAETDTLIAPGENGILYSVKLNSEFDAEAGTVSVDPDGLVKYRYTGDEYGYGFEPDERWLGIENSIVMFRNFAFFGDSGGRMQCVDMNTLELQYVVDITDDTDASLVLEEDAANDTFYLYTANEIDKQDGASTTGKGENYHRKIDGTTGEVIWEVEYQADYGGESSNGGTLSTPHVGKGKLDNMVIFTSTRVPINYINDEGVEESRDIGARIVAYDKETGEELWRHEQPDGYWASVVVVYDDEGYGYVVMADRWGIVKVHDPLNDGEVIAEVDLGSRIESTPSVYNDMLVVGTRGAGGNGQPQRIYGVRLD